MPHTFPEYPGAEFLDFAEACDRLPEPVLKRALVFGIAPLEPYGRWGGSPALRPVPTQWLLPKGPCHPDFAGTPELADTLYAGSLLVAHDAAAHGGPTDPLEVYFSTGRVEEAAQAIVQGKYPFAVTFPPWVGRQARGGRPPARWQEQVPGAKDIDEAVARFPKLPANVERFYTEKGTAMVRVMPDHSVTRKHFLKVLRERQNPKSG